jgi:hypothetical protein
MRSRNGTVGLELDTVSALDQRQRFPDLAALDKVGARSSAIVAPTSLQVVSRQLMPTAPTYPRRPYS